jgi:hypothetical protein
MFTEDQKCKILFFNSYILPIFDFCCTVWGNCSEERIQRITKLQKRAARIILDAPFFWLIIYSKALLNYIV